eukprot:CAMPEP_0194255536 /NCGR_PEP_ID=MMETSP0158-20130606/34665_1 /TAXON_ID=33649 /ORGANISM="Thalassionema nitzschioides, Strain L26-B" /LENGTH=248 /DNA_ID=CAMNT_0038993915 /DNA_START=23 /DNA_END=769 /DNA_ORIENTATION=-
MNYIGGPLFLLRWKGGACPCLEKPEDKGARLGLELLSGLPLKWYRTGRDAKSIGGMVSNWFGGSSSKTQATELDAVEAIIEWADTDKGPELQIKPQQQSNPGGGLKRQPAGYIKTINLSQIDKVSISQNDTSSSFIILQSEKKESSSITDLATLSVQKGDVEQTKEAFTQLVEWDGRRRAAIPDEEREIDEETGLKQRAQKAAHFAKREIEMQKSRREREKRKASLVKETGGLKYTALAMANRIDNGA